MENVIKTIIYIFKFFSDIRGMSDAVNAASTVEELDEAVVGKKICSARLCEQSMAE